MRENLALSDLSIEHGVYYGVAGERCSQVLQFFALFRNQLEKFVQFVDIFEHQFVLHGSYIELFGAKMGFRLSWSGGTLLGDHKFGANNGSFV